MSEKILNTRIQLKNDTEANWNLKTSFIPKIGETIIYNPDSNYNYSRIKIGDGKTTLINLPFLGAFSDWQETDSNKVGYIKNKPVLGTAAAANTSTTVQNDTTLPTGAAIKTFVENKGYTTNTGTVESITLTAGTGISLNSSDAITKTGARTITNTGATGVKGDAESNYRTGNINITKANIGLDKVDNTNDASKPISAATQAALLNKVNVAEGKQLSTNDYTDIEKTKLAAISEEANAVSISGTLASGTQIGVLGIDGVETPLYAPAVTTQTISVTQSASTPTLEFVESTNTSASATLTGVLSVDSLDNGKMIVYMTKYPTPNENLSIQFTYSNGNTATSYPLYAFSNVRSKGVYPTGTCLFIVYYNSAFYLINNSLIG